MAKHVKSSSHQGTVTPRRPRVLIVDDNGAQLNLFAQRSRWNSTGSPLLYGVEPVFVAYGYQSMPLNEDVLHLNTLDDIVAFANDPKNRIDAVISDLYDAPEEISPEQLGLDPKLLSGDVIDPENELTHLVPFGLTLAYLLKKTQFHGPVALSCSHARPVDQVRKDAVKAVENGALGLFDARDFAHKSSGLSAFAAVIEAAQEHRRNMNWENGVA